MDFVCRKIAAGLKDNLCWQEAKKEVRKIIFISDFSAAFFALNQTIQSTEEVRTNSMENNIKHRCKYCLDSWIIVLEMLF